MKVGGSMGLTTWAAFSGSDELGGGGRRLHHDSRGGSAGVAGLRKANLHVVALHNHMVGEQPAFYFTHFWAKGSTVDLATGLKSALDAQAAAAKKGKH